MKRNVPLLVILGSGLMALSLGLVLFLGIRTAVGVQSRQQVLQQLDALLPPDSPGIPGSQPGLLMPVMELEGKDYVAVLEVPGYQITLPVAAQWDSFGLSRCPALFWGSAYDETLVIGGAGDARQFGFCSQIQPGDTVTVTDMTGTRFSYTVEKIDRASQAETPWLTQEDWSLTLFCRDGHTLEYIAVRCKG